ncbi:TPA: hypothetical protein ACKPXR_002162 [Enterococcus faecalis]|nr:hypothetical protein [Enterococcus faecalis]
MKETQERLGHASLEMTNSIYTNRRMLQLRN